MKILIAEDDATTRLVLETTVSHWGYDVVCAEDGQAAWRLLQNEDSPRLLLLDWEIPKLNGIELCRRLQQQQQAGPFYIILLSGDGETERMVEGFKAGANDFIRKPFNRAELQARLRVGQRMVEMHGDLLRVKNDLAYEREIIENILLKMRHNDHFDLSHVRELQEPLERTSGDILLAALRPDGGQHLMLGDFSGHGVTAALGGPGVADIFYSMTAKGLPMTLIIKEMNQRLCRKMPVGLFCAGAFVEINAERGQIRAWNCGMPDILVFRQGELLERVNSSHFSLGIMEQSFDNFAIIDVMAGDRVYAYSDGITEALNVEGEEFGEARLRQAIGDILTTDKDIRYLLDTVLHFRGENLQSDDITLFELTC